MADIVPSLFGMTPGMYQQAQQNRIDAQALQYAQLDPFQQANYAIGRGASGLAGAVGGLLGGQDPELQRITARQQIASQLNPNDLSTFEKAFNALAPTDPQGAMMIRAELEKVRMGQAKLEAERALTGQREAQTVAYLAQAGRERVQATPEKIQLAKEVALLSGPEGSPEYMTAYATSLREQLERPASAAAKEPTTNELTNARAIAAQAGPPGSPEYDAAFNTEYQRLTAPKEPKAPAIPSFGTDRTAVAFEIYNKSFDQLTQAERAVVNKRVEAEQKGTAAAGAAKFVMPGQKAFADIPAFRASVQRTIEPQLKTITATDQALQAINDSLETGNFAGYRAAQVQFARAISGAGDLSQKELKAAGADPSLLGGTADYLSTIFSGTPTADTQKKIRSTLQAIRTVAQKQAGNEVEQQRKIALRSPSYDPAAVTEALLFRELLPTTSGKTTSSGTMAEQAAAEIQRRAAARKTP